MLPKLLSTLRVFGVGRMTVGRGPSSSSRNSGAPKTTVRRRPIRSLDDVVAIKLCTTSCLTVCGAQPVTSGRFPHPSNYFR